MLFRVLFITISLILSTTDMNNLSTNLSLNPEMILYRPTITPYTLCATSIKLDIYDQKESLQRNAIHSVYHIPF